MKKLFAVLAMGVSLAACQTTTEPQTSDASAMRLATQADMKAIDGKTLTNAPGQSYVISSDGSIRGSWNGTPLVGSYQMKDGYFCRVLTQGPSGASPEDCQVLTLEGDTLTGTRNRGTGAKFRLSVS